MRSNSAKLRTEKPSRTRDAVCSHFCAMFHTISSSAGENTAEGRVTNSSKVTKKRIVHLWSAFSAFGIEEIYCFWSQETARFRKNLPGPPRNKQGEGNSLTFLVQKGIT